ncbi:MAG: RusA family crossover junction endodeoxyribonuclease [Oscillospiraceae bacterium]|nr:RusA family crossover junction endodeoxyribonuclease [Oscillospiraceae bacterium]
MQTFVYIISEIPPTLNKFLGCENSWEYRNTKAEWLKKISLCCTPKPRKPLKKAIVTLFFHLKDKRRRDLDNYLKFVLDGLTAAGINRDDNFETIELRLKGTVDKKGITEIFVEELQNDITD